MTVFVVPPNNIYDGIQLRDGDELLVKEGGVIVDTTILLGGSEEIFAGKSEGTEIADGEEELLGGESVNPNEFPVAEPTSRSVQRWLRRLRCSRILSRRLTRPIQLQLQVMRNL